MKISPQDLIRFGLDRYGINVTVTATPSGILAHKTETFPIQDEETCLQVQEAMHNLIELDAMKAEAFMLMDGSFAMQGFKPDMRGQLHGIIDEGMRFYKGRLDLMQKDEILKLIAEWAIDMMVKHGIDPDKVTFSYTPIDRLAMCFVGNPKLGINDTLEIELPTVLTGMNNADFTAWWRSQVRFRYDEIFGEIISAKLVAAREHTRATLDNIDKLERLFRTKCSQDDARTAPGGIRRPTVDSANRN